jgi:hypothetical protein
MTWSLCDHRQYNDWTIKKTYKFCQKAIMKGSLSSLEWVFNKGILEKKDDCLGTELFRYAAEQGNFDFLDFLKSHDLKYNDSTSAGAALGVSLECLQWAIENSHPTSKWVSACAASKGNIKMLGWLHENKHPFNYISTVYSILSGDI